MWVVPQELKLRLKNPTCPRIAGGRLPCQSYLAAHLNLGQFCGGIIAYDGTFPPKLFSAHPHDIITKTASSAGVTPRRAETASTRARTPGGTMDNGPPNPNIHTIVKAQIVFLLSTLTEDNFDFNQNQIHTVSTLDPRLSSLPSSQNQSLTCFPHIC